MWDGSWMFFLALVIFCAVFLFRVALGPVGGEELPRHVAGSPHDPATG
jgi:hypothetical protein